MDVAILGTDEFARRLARLCVTDGNDQVTGVGGVSLYGSEATAVMDAADAIEDELRERPVPNPAASADRLDGTTDLDTAVGDADIVVDARRGDVGTKRERLATLEEHVDPDATIAVRPGDDGATTLAVALERPERAVGVSMTAAETPGVIEIVRADQTDDATVETVRELVESLGWRPIVVNDAPGLLSRRLQLALEVEAMRAVEADVAAPADVDATMESGFGLTDGPLASADRAGLDRRLEELRALADELGDRFSPPAVLEAKVDAGDLGATTGVGFRVWDNGHPVDGSDGHSADDTDG